MTKTKNKKPDKERFSLVKIKPKCEYVFEYKKYYAGDTVVIPSISVNNEIHNIIKEI